MGKSKDKEVEKEEGEEQVILSPIANPLAQKKLKKKTLKLLKKAAKGKGVRRGVKEVQKALRKGEKGVCVMAGDISPIDVITHIPVLCEEKEVPYVFVPSKEELGSAGQTKRPTSCVLITLKDGADYKDEYKECMKEVKSVQPQF